MYRFPEFKAPQHTGFPSLTLAFLGGAGFCSVLAWVILFEKHANSGTRLAWLTVAVGCGGAIGLVLMCAWRKDSLIAADSVTKAAASSEVDEGEDAEEEDHDEELDPVLVELANHFLAEDPALFLMLENGRMKRSRYIYLSLARFWFRQRRWRNWLKMWAFRGCRVINRVALFLYHCMPCGVYMVPGWHFGYPRSQSGHESGRAKEQQ